MRYAKAIRWCALLAAACVGARDVGAQLAAFPGAEGAAQFATGGRGGDVYVVTNLNNTGAGSLRNGITSATGPRTIVFAVSGTIRLTSDLTINRSNITIAGQTAPGGGITLADRMVRVNNVSNVVLQHLRMRVGNTYANYEPDALWISGSNNVMIDHVSASWGVDEVLSATHGSSNVTVQWSMITEALHNAGHSKGNHGYGSLVNGGNFSFHHNLYAHNRSRNPRPQQSSVAGQLTQFDFVNNVIANPGDRFGYTGDETLNINWVGNYGISGQNTTAGALFHIPGGSSNVGFYAEGNVLDSNKNGILDGTPATGSRLVTNNHPLAG
ncbi:MAG TPA: hypothetical protein PKC18_14450, partial [Lacipirellulaceae bacterium]|nr:hypothetical protein [Lacipirellulaceae bacterium]